MVHEDPDVLTLGHSTRSADDFGKILKAHQIEILVDVRTFPGSRRYPQFNRESLSQFLVELEIKYVMELHPYTPAARIVNGELSYRGMLDGEG